uniref:Apple domain-containing protein n=1 Tax=Oryza glaberrima TaxID=4538 RepID=I1R753_ORYGL
MDFLLLLLFLGILLFMALAYLSKNKGVHFPGLEKIANINISDKECQEHFLSASPECQAVISMPNGQPNDDRCRLLTGQRGMLGIMTASSFSGSNL